jgi:hypothetical protein
LQVCRACLAPLDGKETQVVVTPCPIHFVKMYLDSENYALVQGLPELRASREFQAYLDQGVRRDRKASLVLQEWWPIST